MYSDTAKIMWDDIRKRYAIANTPRIHQLKANIAVCKQGDMEVSDFFSKLANLWNELSNVAKVPLCNCSVCKCGASTKILAMYKEDRAQQFLMGRNDDSYATIRSQILALDPLPSLDRMTQQEETHRKDMMARDNRNETAAAFTT